MTTTEHPESALTLVREFDPILTKFVQVQSADPMDATSNTGLWVAMHMDMDYVQAFLIEVRWPYRYIDPTDFDNGATVMDYIFMLQQPSGDVMTWAYAGHDMFDRTFDRWALKARFLDWVRSELERHQGEGS